MCFGINRFHFCAMFTWLIVLFFATQMIFPIFANFLPRWRCTENGTNNIGNFSQQINEEFGQNCEIYRSCPSDQLQFEQDPPFHSSAFDFGWLCGTFAAYNRALYSQCQFFGVLIGTMAFGALSDAFGRRPISIFVLTFGILAMLASAYAPTWHFLLATRFFVGLSIGGSIVVVCTLVNELILPNQRMVVRGFFNWGIARLAMTLLCLAFPHWRSASIALAIGCLPALLSTIFILPESPLWLHNKNQMAKMIESEKKMAFIAGIEFAGSTHNKPLPAKQRSLRDLIHEKALFKRIVVLWIMWFIASISSYSADLNSSSISGNLYFNQCFLSLLIAFSKISLFTVDTFFPNFSRRNLHQWSQLVVVVCFLALSILTIFEYQQGLLVLLLNLTGITINELCWDACYLCAIESVPTTLRSSSVGSCSLIARFGALFAPLLVFLNSLWMASAYVMVVMLGSLNLLNSFFGLVETKGVDLDIVELDDGPRKRSKSRSSIGDGTKLEEEAQELVALKQQGE